MRLFKLVVLLSMLMAGQAAAQGHVVADRAYLAPVANGEQAAKPFFNDAVTTVVQVKATAGVLYGPLRLVNTTAAVAYLQIFFKPSASVTLGATTPDWTIRLGANETLPLSLPSVGVGVQGGTGISIAGTTTATGSTGAAISVGASFN